MMPIRRLAARSPGPSVCAGLFARVGLAACVGLATFAVGATSAAAASLFGGNRPGVVEVGVRELPAEDAWQASWRLPDTFEGVWITAAIDPNAATGRRVR